MSLIGLDLGTSFLKGAVLDLDGLHIDRVRRVPFPDPLPGLPPLRKEYDPRAVLAAVRKLLDELLDAAPEAEGLVMCSQMHGLIFTDAHGAPLSTLTTWQDQRVLEASPGGGKHSAGGGKHSAGGGSYFDALRARLGPEELRGLGNELHPGQPLGVLFWLAEQGRLPDRDAVPASLPDFVAAALCGAPPVTETTNAAAHGAFKLQTLGWHTEVLERLGVQGLRWPEIVPHGTVVGRLPVGSRAIPCYTPVGDYQAAMAGALLQPGELSLNISTGSQVSLLQSHPAFGDYQTRPFFDGRTLATITHVPAGRALAALVRLLTELSEAQGVTLSDPWPTIAQRVIAQRAAAAGPPRTRVDLAFFSSSCGDEGAITGIREEELTVGHLFRAAFEGMAENYAACAARLSPERAWERLVFSGGLAQIEVLREIIRERFGVSYRMAPSSEDTLLGLLALGLAFTGRAASVETATRRMLTSGQ